MAFAPDAVMVASNTVPDFFPGLKVQLFHGFSVSKRSDAKGHYRIRGFFDLYCTQGPATTRNFEILAAKYGHFKVVETGWPKLDPLFPQRHPPTPEADTCPRLLVTSTFTPALSLALPLYAEISALAKTRRWQILVTLHPKMAPATVQLYRDLQDEFLTFVETDNILPLLEQADVMLSDTSSVVFEFLLLGKPVVTFRNRKPGPWLLNIEQPAQLAGTLQQALAPPADLQQAIADLGRQIHPYGDGRSSQRVLEAVDQFIDLGWKRELKPKPLNLLRRWKTCRRLQYPLYKTFLPSFPQGRSDRQGNEKSR
jgi:CDP-glycerol glycerophosphotransferase (TagB/SpsB family)